MGGAPQDAGSQGAAAIEALYQKAPEAKAHIDSIAHDIAGASEGSVQEAPPKGKDRAQEKIAQDYNGDHTKLTDVVRNTIIVPHDKYADAVQMLHNHPDLHGEIKHIKPTVDKMGYGGTIAKMKTPNGLIGEVQLNTPEMIYAKESEKSARKALGNDLYDQIAKVTGIQGGQGHKLYEQWRDIEDKTSDVATALAQKSKVYYNDVKTLWQKNQQ